MGFFDRLSRLVRANANAALTRAEDPVKILDQSVADMQADLVKLRQAVASYVVRAAEKLRRQRQREERAMRLRCESARAASSALPATRLKAPTRSPYSEKDLEKELDRNTGCVDSANRRGAKASTIIELTSSLLPLKPMGSAMSPMPSTMNSRVTL